MLRPILLAVLTSVAHGYVSNGSYPTFASCRDTIVSAIRTFQAFAGPQNVFKNIDESDTFTVFHTSYTYHNSESKCIYANYADGILNFTFYSKNGAAPSTLSYTAVQGDDGVVRGRPVRDEDDAPQFRYAWYPVFFSRGVLSNYACSEGQGTSEPPLVNVMVSKNYVAKNSLLIPAIRGLVRFLEGVGFNFRYNYGLECLMDL